MTGALLTRSSVVSSFVGRSLSFVRNKSENAFKYLMVKTTGEKQNVGLIRLNDRRRMNSLSMNLVSELNQVLENFERDDAVLCTVVTGSERVFSVGADIAEMQNMKFEDVLSHDFPSHLLTVGNCRKPVIAAVNGYAMGGGCELAMMCDIIYSSDTAVFSQPEILLGVIPGASGTQRLSRAVGRARAFEMVVSGDQMSAQEAYHAGLVSKLYQSDAVLNEAVKLAECIASLPPLLVQMAKQAVNQAFESSLSEGLQFEKTLFLRALCTSHLRSN